jgi:mannose-6-phosphate isomerase-like protein (cupin superfamily)
MRSALIVLLVVAVTACMPRTPRVTLAPLAGGLDAFVAAHPLAADRPLRVDEVGRTPGGSYHLVQIQGSETPHRHVKHDLTILVLRGRGTLTLGDERFALAAGDAAVIPRGVPHWFANTGGSAAAVALVVYTPPLDAPDVVPVPVSGR